MAHGIAGVALEQHAEWPHQTLGGVRSGPVGLDIIRKNVHISTGYLNSICSLRSNVEFKITANIAMEEDHGNYPTFCESPTVLL